MRLDVTDMFIRQVTKMHHKAEEALMQYQVAHADRTDALIAVLREITLAYKAEGSREERLALIETLLEKDADQILVQCMAHEAVAGSNHLSFLAADSARVARTIKIPASRRFTIKPPAYRSADLSHEKRFRHSGPRPPSHSISK
jgi:hypothetical protein